MSQPEITTLQPNHEASRAAPSALHAARPLVMHVRSISGHGGGPEKTILNSPRFLKELGYDAVCAFLHDRDERPHLAERAAQADAPLVSVPDRGFWDLSVLPRLVQLCRDRRVAIWHGHEYKSNVLGLLARRFWPMKLVTTVHGWNETTRRAAVYYKIDKRCLPYYDQVICVSEDLYEECLRVGVPASRCQLVRNAIDANEYNWEPSSSAAKHRFGTENHRILLGAMGRLSAEKGFDLLIEAVDSLLRDGHDVELLIAGEGQCRPALQTRIDTLGKQDRIRLLGHVAAPKDFLHALDVFVLSSRSEALPNVVLEAMALEVPVVATRSFGVPGLVTDNVTGVAVEPHSVQALVDGLRRVLRDADLRHRLAFAARQMIETSFSFRQRMQRIAGIYDGVLDTGSGAGFQPAGSLLVKGMLETCRRPTE